MDHSLPDGYGFRLGQALRNNTVVAAMTLDLRQFRVDGDNDHVDNISVILQFLRGAASLEMVIFFRARPCIRINASKPCRKIPN
jgi:hypothetical protein